MTWWERRRIKLKLRNVFAELKIYGKNYMRSKTALFFVFIFPLLFMLIFGSIFSGGSSSPPSLYVQNLDGNSTVTMQFITALNDTHIVTVRSIPTDANITTYISQHSISAALRIPSGFSSDFVQGNNVSLTYYNNPSQSTSAIALQAIQYVVQSFNNGGAPSVGNISLATASVSFKAANTTDYLIPGLIGLVILTSPMFSMTFVVSSYKKNKIFRQLSLTPLSKSEWFVSKFFWYLIISALSAVEIVAVGYFLFHSEVTLNIYVIPFLLLGVFLFTSLGILAGSVSKSEEGASVIGNIITFPMMFLSGTFFPVSIMPGWLQTVAHILPLYYIIDGLNSVMVYSNMASALTDIIVSVAVAIVIFIATLSTFSWKED